MTDVRSHREELSKPESSRLQESMTVGSLFSGIGGLDLGLERAGMRVVWQSEIDPYCNRVLAKHWPDIPNLGDVKDIDWRKIERPHLICGGYPCQPFSFAGKRRGTNDPRHLWPYFADSLRAFRPDWALLENVPGHLTLGFGDVHADLAALGYDTEWESLPARAFGAPHLRYRVIVVAHANNAGSRASEPTTHHGRTTTLEQRKDKLHSRIGGRGEDLDDPERSESQGCPATGSDYSIFPVEIAEGLGRGWEVEPDVGRVAHGVPARMDRLRALGNAIVPQLAEWIGERILAFEEASVRDS